METNVYESDLERVEFNELVNGLIEALENSTDKKTSEKCLDLINEVVTIVECQYIHEDEVMNHINDNPPELS